MTPTPAPSRALLLITALVLATVTAAGAQTGAVDVALPAPRLAGGDRVATSAAVASAWAARGARSDVAVVVPRQETAIALATAGLAGREGGVTVLSDVPPSPLTVGAVRDSGATRVIVVGGAADMVDAWEAEGFATTSLDAAGGAPAVAAVVARELIQGAVDDGSQAVYLAGTTGLPDALAVGPLARRAHAPILLTDAGALDPHTRFVIQQEGIGAITVLGGTAAVGEGVVAELESLGVTVDRIAGEGREATALALAAGQPGDHLYLVAGQDPADAVTVAALAESTGGVLIAPGPTTRAWLTERCGSLPALTVVGGPAVIDAHTEDAHRRAAQRCDSIREAMTVRVAVATPGAPGSEEAVLAMVTGAEGWTSSRIRLVGVGDAPHLGVLVAHPGSCGTAALCRVGQTMVVDGGHWAAATAAMRSRLVNVAVGSWLGEGLRAVCAGSVMDPLDCPGSPAAPSATEREEVADRYVPTVTLTVGGDVHGERHIATAVAAGRNPLGPLAGHLAAADIAVLNLETPLSTRGTPASKTFVFRGPPAMAADLVEAGVDIVSLANNHALDYGPVALQDTLDHAAAAGLQTVGAGPDATAAYAPVVVDSAAGRVAVIGLTRVLHTRTWEATATRAGLASAYDEPAAIAAVARARELADHVVVAIHWGTERADCPDVSQRHLARVLADAGADVVVGHHPHVLQGVQQIDRTLVVYSLGNLVWYHDRAPSRFTGLLDVELPILGRARWSLLPAEIGGDGSPRPATGALGSEIIDRLLVRSPGGSVGCAFP